MRYESSVFYANVENFSYKITKLSGVNASEISQKINKLKSDHEKLIKRSKPNKVTKRNKLFFDKIHCLAKKRTFFIEAYKSSSEKGVTKPRSSNCKLCSTSFYIYFKVKLKLNS